MASDVRLTADLDAGSRSRVRALLDEAFEGAFGSHDWAHALGGVHALVHDGERLVGHGAVVERRLLHGQHVLRTGYVEAVAVAPDQRRRGVASASTDRARRAWAKRSRQSWRSALRGLRRSPSAPRLRTVK